ncbi:MAG: acetyl-CoA synthase subunit gamma [Candidatus Cloacimonadota bacterium]|nr:MAG: acetyl-CoA synthase subunit gamma [Candidatus Cloacimonadota bacterium]
MKKQYIEGWIDTKAGKIPKVSTDLSRADKWGTLKVRWSINRMNYKVNPGLYGVGNPDEDSLVFVSANYKLSFDILRRELTGLDAWIMVLDTKGINVWCAAGKGTFGTKEMVNRIRQTRLPQIVRHRKLIVPQLGATGVSAHLVTRHTGFLVFYGPVRTFDIKSFLENGMKASKEMRQVRFSFYDRLLLVPTEVVHGLKYLVFAMALFFLLSGLSRSGYSSETLLNTGFHSSLNLMLAYLAGTVLGPLLLPWLPGRSFSLKGFFPGLVLFVIAFLGKIMGKGLIGIIAWMLLFTAISSFILMNFTGASTYTSLSGVKKEMRVAVPLQIAAFAIGAALWIVNRFV